MILTRLIEYIFFYNKRCKYKLLDVKKKAGVRTPPIFSQYTPLPKNGYPSYWTYKISFPKLTLNILHLWSVHYDWTTFICYRSGEIWLCINNCKTSCYNIEGLLHWIVHLLLTDTRSLNYLTLSGQVWCRGGDINWPFPSLFK